MTTNSAMANEQSRLTFVYYCSGHGYGHATRVSAFARHLLSLDNRPNIHIVSSAPKHVFADSIAVGAFYRNAHIDPVIVQPLAYRVDRQKSVEVLETFLTKKDAKVWDESQWLRAIHADCVLSDAAFLGCLAAHHAGIPSVLITNFSFDSVYSYLSTPLIDEPNKPEFPALDGMLSPPSAKAKEELEPDVPIPNEVLTPYLPSPDWVDLEARCFKSSVIDHLTQPPSSYELLPQLPFPDHYPRKPLSREARSAPLLVRPPNQDVYKPEGRSRLLESIGVPAHLHDPNTTKILIVSFGGQVFHRPHSRGHSRTSSKASTPKPLPPAFGLSPNGIADAASSSTHPASPLVDPEGHARALSDALQSASIAPPPSPPSQDNTRPESMPPLPRPIPPHVTPFEHSRHRSLSSLRLAGAPPAAVPTSPRTANSATFSAVPTFEAVMIPPTPRAPDGFETTEPAWDSTSTSTSTLSTATDSAAAAAEEILDQADVRILPSESWIAIVCGVSKDWGNEAGEEPLPDNFFVAPRDVYMPDLTAVADVLLGKLGYGTVSECVDACTPFVYVPRPLFVEEHGLRLLLQREGVGVELERVKYEVGEWAEAVEEAWVRGREAKARKRREGETGRRTEEGREMARFVVDWVGRWKEGVVAQNVCMNGKQALVNGKTNLKAPVVVN
ncbi:hypothetical protein C8Q74DRAFT_1251708 [Fomes fomentarius]|nr:hypothetical protein C8Q74DRAFT_1251708 [Fomes fomentarius]